MRQIFVVTFCPRPCVFINIYGSTFIFSIFFSRAASACKHSVSCLFTTTEILLGDVSFRDRAITIMVFINIFVLLPALPKIRTGFGS